MYQTIAPKQGVQGAWGVDAEGATAHACTLEKPHTRSVCRCLCHYPNSFGCTHREQALKMEVTEGGEKRFPQQHWHRHAHHAPLFAFFSF